MVGKLFVEGGVSMGRARIEEYKVNVFFPSIEDRRNEDPGQAAIREANLRRARAWFDSLFDMYYESCTCRSKKEVGL